MPESLKTGEKVFRGIPVSAGVSRGKILVLGKTNECLPFRTISEEDLPKEIERLEQALVLTRQQIMEVQRRVSEAMGAQDASIFDAHLLVLEDRTLLDEVSRVMAEDKVNVEQAFSQVAGKYADTLGSMDDEYLRERAADMRDVTARVLNNLLGKESGDLRHLKEPCIIISYDLSPSTTAVLDRSMVLGLATDIGSKTSHTAIMARSLRIPAIVGLQNASEMLESGEYALLDGHNGLLILNPTDQTLFEYGQLVRKALNLEEKLRDLADKPAVTLDGHRLILSANIEAVADTASVKDSGAEGVGLFRTEFLFLNRDTLPTEEEQFQAYSQAAAALLPDPLIIRTLDLGGDKFLSHLQVPMEMNPFLGWRAIRFCLQEKEIFRTQIRAILRASSAGNIKMMYPMISCLDEMKQARELLDEYKAELRAENTPFNEHLEIGAMMEIPSAVLIADTLAKKVNFFSIGSNDLIQYTLAVDRMNEKIAHLYEPTHPAIIKLIGMTVEAARRNNIWVGVCGEIASDLHLVPLLLGLGIDELSVAPPFIPQIKFLIRRLKMSECKELAKFALASEFGGEILRRCQELARHSAPGLFEK